MKTHSQRKCLLFITVILSAVIMLVSCQKDNSYPGTLRGSWVETTTKIDTIIFNSGEETGTLTLHRGYEIRNGYRLPIIGSDFYRYEIRSDNIRLRGGVSAVYFDENFYFKYDESNLTISIGKFSKYIDTNNSILTFRKIK